MTSMIMPGETLDVQATRLGPGLTRNNQEIVAVAAGLVQEDNGSVWVESFAKRYVPNINEPVIGTIISKNQDNYKVDIGCAHTATLPLLAFEGANRRNRPNVEVGGVVYCRLTVANKDMEPELSCIAASGKAEGYGPLPGGFITKCTLDMARSLMNPETPVFRAFEGVFSFETAVGMNGLVWLKAETARQMATLATLVQQADRLPHSKLAALVQFHKKEYSTVLLA